MFYTHSKALVSIRATNLYKVFALKALWCSILMSSCWVKVCVSLLILFSLCYNTCPWCTSLKMLKASLGLKSAGDFSVLLQTASTSHVPRCLCVCWVRKWNRIDVQSKLQFCSQVWHWQCLSCQDQNLTSRFCQILPTTFYDIFHCCEKEFYFYKTFFAVLV